MAERRLKRPRDPLQLAKLIGDIAAGQVEDGRVAVLGVPPINSAIDAVKAAVVATSRR